jgi:antirestriction protein
MNHEQPMSGEPSPPHPSERPTTAPEQHEAEPVIQPRIWVASLTDYNNGIMHGEWLDAARDESVLQADIDAMLAASPWTARTDEPAEEWVVRDYENFGDCNLLELSDLGLISQIAQGIVQHGPAFAAWAGLIDHEERLAEFDEAYLGHYDDLHTYIKQLINDLGYDRILDEVVPPSIRPYVKIDITAIANDLLLGGDLHTVAAPDGGVWIFRG